MDFLKLVAELGFPIAGAMAAGYFVFLILLELLAVLIAWAVLSKA